MRTNEIRELITDYFDDLYRHSIDNINQIVDYADVRKAYKDALKHLKSDIRVGNVNATDFYTPIEDFKGKSGISSDEFKVHSNFILPMLRQGNLEHFTKLIEYGDAKYQIELDRVLLPNSVNLNATNSTKQQNKTPLIEAINEFIKERSKLGAVGNKHIENQKSDLELLVEIVGKTIDIEQFNGELVRNVKSVLIELPKNRKKNALTRNLELHDAIEVQGVEKINGKTVNGYLGTYRTFFKWLVDNKYLDLNPFAGVRVEVKKKPRQERRQAYTQEAIEITYNALCSGDIVRDGYKWAALIGLFTGARLAEICQLEVADIVIHDGILCFNINSKPNSDNNFKNLKSEAAHRLVPIHSHLKELGIVEYARMVRSQYGNASRLFPDFVHHKDKGYTKNFGRWYNESLMSRLGIKL